MEIYSIVLALILMNGERRYIEWDCKECKTLEICMGAISTEEFQGILKDKFQGIGVLTVTPGCYKQEYF